MNKILKPKVSNFWFRYQEKKLLTCVLWLGCESEELSADQESTTTSELNTYDDVEPHDNERDQVVPIANNPQITIQVI